MSQTKETKEFAETFGTVAPSDVKGEIKAEKDEIDDIISYFEENMLIDGLTNRYGVGIDCPDVETYVGDKQAAREFVIDKIQAFIDREFKRKTAVQDVMDTTDCDCEDYEHEPPHDMNDLD